MYKMATSPVIPDNKDVFDNIPTFRGCIRGATFNGRDLLTPNLHDSAINDHVTMSSSRCSGE